VRRADDGGNAMIEFVFVAVIVMVPLIYLVLAVAAVQRSQLAVSEAAREAGRAFATADRAEDARSRAQIAVRIALRDHELPDDATVRYVAAGASCSAPAITPRLAAGAQFTICVIRDATLPAIPRFLAGKGITSQGEYVVHIDDYRSVS
jgi:Flp pilus assembly protein TadG